MTTKKRHRKPVVQGEARHDGQAEQKGALIELRSRLNLSQTKMAESLGVSLQSITRYETRGEPLPFKVAARLADLARAHGWEDLQQWFSNYLTTALQTRVGANQPLSFEVGAFQANQEVQTLVLSFQQLWDVYRQHMGASSPEAESMRAHLNQIWVALRHRIAPERKVVCVHCGQADQTQIYVSEGQVRYLCRRCNQVGLII